MAYHLYACRRCWFRLPVDLRRPISRNYGVDFVAHAAAMGDAQRWFDENPLPSSKPVPPQPPTLF